MAPPDKKDGAENSKPDWAEIITTLISHTSLRLIDIVEMTIPAIEAILSRLNKHISIKIGMPGIFGGVLDNPAPAPSPTGKPPKLSEFMAFANAFNDIS